VTTLTSSTTAANGRMVAIGVRPYRVVSRLATSGLAWSAVVSVAVVWWVMVGLGGFEYYRTPLSVRAYAPAHHLLGPSAPVGQTLGLVGALLMLMPFLYMARKRTPTLKGAGTLRAWLEVHLFCGVVGPVLITLHTSFKFNGIVSAAYWSMVIVVLSGFVGRYLYVRIPRSIRGTEMTRAELDARAEELRSGIARSVDSPTMLARIEAFERSAVPDADRISWIDLALGELVLAWRLRGFDRQLERAGLAPGARAEIIRLTADRSTLLRRLAYLQRTKKLFELWHVFHLPLVYLMLLIVTAHVAITLYLGYVPFRW
jgi:hypothetical protein